MLQANRKTAKTTRRAKNRFGGRALRAILGVMGYWRFQRVVLRFALSVFVMAGPALTQVASDWGVSGDWLIRVDPGAGDGCFMQRQYESGTMVRIGYVPKDGGAFLSAHNPAWTQIVAGERGSVIFDFGDSRFQGEAFGVNENGVPGGYAFFNNPEFASEFGRRHSVAIQGKNGAEEIIDLSGSMAALGKLKACQAEQD